MNQWKVTPTKSAAKELIKLPKNIQLIYRQLVEDLEDEGPFPTGWIAEPLKGRGEIKIRLNREYRVLIKVIKPNIIVIKIAHRKDVYK